MESLLASEVARLVYGYLIDEKCEAAAQLFLETSDHLKECYNAQKKGRKFTTRILGCCLMDILNLYCDAVCMYKNFKEKKNLSNIQSVSDVDELQSLNVDLYNVLQDLGNVLVLSECSEQNKQKTVFVRISIPPKKKGSINESPEKKEASKNQKEPDKKEKEKNKDQNSQDGSFDSATVAKNVSSNLDDFDLNMMQTLLDNTALHERIAENINKAIDSSGEINISETTKEKKIVESVLHSTEADPIFEELLHMLTNPRADDTTTPEDTDKENGDPSEERRPTDGAIPTSQEQETMKRLEAENNMAIEELLAGNKKAQEQSIPPPAVTSSVNPVHQIQGTNQVTTIVLSPPGVTELMPVTSTPLQTISATSISNIVGVLSPVSGQNILLPINAIPRSLHGVIRGRGTGRNRRIIPKFDSIQQQQQSVYQFQVVHEPSTKPDDTPAATPKIIQESLKNPRARTRGGLQKKASRGVKSIAPQITKVDEEHIDITFVEKNSNPGIRTRSMAHKLRPIKKIPEPKGKKGKTSPKLKGNGKEGESPQKRDETMSEGEDVDDYPPPLNNSKKAKEKDASKLIVIEEEPSCSSNESSPVKDPASSKSVVQDSEKISQSVITLLKEPMLVLPRLDVEKNQLQRQEGSEVEPELPLSEQNCEREVMNTGNKSVENIQVEVQDPESKDETCVPEEKIKEPGSVMPTGKDGDESTPDQQVNVGKNSKRISLSTPRRGSHVRALEFKTPEKPIGSRKSLTSPKAYAKTMPNNFMFSKAKREILKSPDQKVDSGVKNVESAQADGPVKTLGTKTKSDWDADLRQFMDIPTSVGLKRKPAQKKDSKKRKTKTKAGVTKPTKTTRQRKPRVTKKLNSKLSPIKLSPIRSSNEDLVSQIEKEVRDAIGEIPLDSSLISSTENLSDLTRNFPESNNKSRTSSCSESMVIDEENNTVQPQLSEMSLGNTITDHDISSHGKEVTSNVSESCVSLPPEEKSLPPCAGLPIDPTDENAREKTTVSAVDEIREKSTFLSNPMFTPLKATLSPLKEDSIGLTPNTKLILNQIDLNLSPSSIASSYSNLESILINEGSRLEQENAAARGANKHITKLPDPPQVECESRSSDKSSVYKSSVNVEEHIKIAPIESALQEANQHISNLIDSSNTVSESQTTTTLCSGIFEESKRHIPVECVVKQSSLFTPAKMLPSHHVPPGLPVEITPISKLQPEFPVEMTPLSKVLDSETRFLSTALVTPTLPATPKPRYEKSPEGSSSSFDASRISQNEDLNKIKPVNETLNTSENENSSAVKVVIAVADTNTEGLVAPVIKEPSASPVCEESVKVDNTKACPVAKDKMKVKNTTPKVVLSLKKNKIAPPKKQIVKPSAALKARRISSSSDSSLDESIVGAGKKSLNSSEESSRNCKDNLVKSPIRDSKTKKMNDSLLKSTKKSKISTEGKKVVKKPSPAKKVSQFDVDLMEKEKELIKECLESAKAKSNALFGLISSDSDTSDGSIEQFSPLKSNALKDSSLLKTSSKPVLKFAHDTLQKIKNVSMLVSSSSSDDDDILSFGGKVAPIDSNKEGKSVKSSSNKIDNPVKSDPSKCISKAKDSVFSKVLPPTIIPNPKKLDSPKRNDKTKENMKLILREREESCESFPALYLSEESNMSIVSETHTVKSAKMSKSPIGSIESHPFKKTAVSSSAGVSPLLKSTFEKPSNSKPSSVQSKQPTSPSTEDHQVPETPVRTEVKGPLDTYETVVYTSPATKGLTSISSQERHALSKYLDDYTFSFTLDDEGRDDVLCKTLKTSQFFTIFEMNIKAKKKSERCKSPEPERSERHKSPLPTRSERHKSPTRRSEKHSSPTKKSDRSSSPKSTGQRRNDRHRSGRSENHPGPLREERGKSPLPMRSERRLSPSPQREHTRKRHRSCSSSDDERRKYPRYQGTSRWNFRGRGSFRKSKFPGTRHKFHPFPHFENTPRYRERPETFRGKIKRPLSKRSSNEHHIDPSPHSGKSNYSFEKRFSVNDSLRSSKSNEGDRLFVDQSFNGSDDLASSCEKSKTNERTLHRSSEKKKGLHSSDREDGELTDCSEYHTASSAAQEAAREAKRKELIALMSDSSRAKLLKSVDLDRFLTMLHGAEK